MLTIDQIQQAIAKQGAEWRAEDTEIFRRGLGSTADNMLGLHVTADERMLMAESKGHCQVKSDRVSTARRCDTIVLG